MSDEPFSHQGSDTRRLDRVETEVDALRGSVTEMRSDIRSVVVAVGEIKDALKTRDSREVQSELAKRPPIVAIVAVLITLVIAMTGGSWTSGYKLGRLDERDSQRDREINRMQSELDRLEDRQWQRATGDTK